MSLFTTIKAGMRVLYSTPLHPRTFGTLQERAANRAFWIVKSEAGEVEIIHKSDIMQLI